MAERAKWDPSTGLAEDVDWDDRESGEPAPLTEEEKAMLLARIRKVRIRRTPKRQHFQEATTWVLYVFGWMLLKDDPDAPWSYGARFVDFANYIEHKREERRREEEEEELDDPAYM